MLVQIQKDIRFRDPGYEMCYRVAQKALSDRPWYENVDAPDDVFIPVRENEKYIIDFIVGTLVNGTGSAPIAVHRIYDDYARFRKSNTFCETKLMVGDRYGSVEILPINIDLFDYNDLQHYLHMDFHSEITFQQFMKQNMELYSKGMQATEVEIANLARSIIAHGSVFQEESFLNLRPWIYSSDANGDRHYMRLDVILAGLLVEAARRAVPILEEFHKDRMISYPVDTLVKLLSKYPTPKQHPIEDTFNSALIAMLTRIANSKITSVPFYLVEAALYYLQENDVYAAEQIRDILFGRKDLDTQTIFLSDEDTVFNAIAAASVFKRMDADVDHIMDLTTDITADDESLILELEIASVVDTAAFYRFLEEIVHQGDILGFDVRKQISTFLLDDDKIADFERTTANRIIKNISRVNLEPNTESEDSTMDTNKLEKDCENVVLANGVSTPVSTRVAKKFTIVNALEAVSITIDRRLLNSESECEKDQMYSGSDSYGFLDLLSAAVHAYSRSLEGDESEFAAVGKSIGTTLTKIYSDYGYYYTQIILTTAFRSIVVPKISYADFMVLYTSYIQDHIHTEELQMLVNTELRKIYELRLHTEDTDLALILLAAASAEYVKGAGTSEDGLLSWIHFTLHKALGVSTARIKQNLDLLIDKLDAEEMDEETLEYIFNPNHTWILFGRLFARLVDNSVDAKKVNEAWSEKFEDAILVAYSYLKGVVYDKTRYPIIHNMLANLPVNKARLSEMNFLAINQSYSVAEIILRTAWTLPWIEDDFEPVLDKLKDDTADSLGESVNDIAASYFNHTAAVENFKIMYNSIGLEHLLNAFRLSRDDHGNLLITDLNKFRVIAVKSIKDTDLISETFVGSRDIGEVVRDFFGGSMKEYDRLYDVMKMICA